MPSKPVAMLDNTTTVKTCFYMLGFDARANPVEILYNRFGENGVNVFHAMPCRNDFLRLFEEGDAL